MSEPKAVEHHQLKIDHKAPKIPRPFGLSRFESGRGHQNPGRQHQAWTRRLEQPGREALGRDLDHPFGEQGLEPEQVQGVLVEHHQHGVAGERAPLPAIDPGHLAREVSRALRRLTGPETALNVDTQVHQGQENGPALHDPELAGVADERRVGTVRCPG